MPRINLNISEFDTSLALWLIYLVAAMDFDELLQTSEALTLRMTTMIRDGKFDNRRTWFDAQQGCKYLLTA